MLIRLPLRWIFPALLCLAALPASGQDQSHVVVVKASKHAFAPPLIQMAPLPPRPAAEDDDRAPLRPHRSATTEDAAPQSSRDLAPIAALSPLTTNPGVNVLGVGAGFTNYPPTPQSSVADTNGAVGPTQFVQFVNDSYAVFNKSDGSVALAAAGGDTLWRRLGLPCYGSLHLDEIAQFDKINQRWVMMMPSTSSLCIAVSATTDATGAWNLYSFPLQTSPGCGGGLCAADYPKLAVWPDAYYVSYNESNKGVFVGDAVCALDGASMRAGSKAAKMQCFLDQLPAYGDMLPADFDGTTPPPTGSPAYFLNFDSNLTSLDLWQFHVDWNTTSNTTFTGPTRISGVIPAIAQPCGEGQLVITYTNGHCIPQVSTTNTLDSYGDRLMYRVAYRNFPGTSSIPAHESILANQTVQPGGSSNPTAIQWYELQSTGSGFSIYQQGTYSPDNSYRWAGSIAMDQAGDIALGYSVSSAASATNPTNPTIRYTGRLFTDTPGQMEGEVDILSAAGITNPGALTNTFHWADYASMSIDPTDDCTFWFTTEYVAPGNTNWSTRIASFKFPSCGVAPPPPDFSLSFSPAASQTVTAGNPATFTVGVTPSGSFSGTVNLACVPPTGVEITCAFNPSSATSTTSSTLTVMTTAPTVARVSARPSPLAATWLAFPALALVAIGSLGRGSRKRCVACLILCVTLAGSATLATSCGGGNSSGGQQNGGTPKGTYTVNISAISGNITHSPTVTVTVQ